MIACVSPGFSSANHTINTLRYSDRLKEKKRPQQVIKEIKENNYIKNNFLIEVSL
jgi:kinesin family protein 2/24